MDDRVKHFDRKVEFSVLEELRRKCDELGDLSAAKKAEILEGKIAQLKGRRLLRYVEAMSKTTDYIFSLLREGKIGMYVHRVLAQCPSKITDEVKDFLADEFLESNMTVRQLEKAKAILIRDNCSVSDALKRSQGRLSGRKSRTPRGVTRSFEQLVDDIGKLSVTLRMKIEMAVELLPKSVLREAEIHSEVFFRAYMMRHQLKEHLEYVDRKVEGYLEEIRNCVIHGESRDVPVLQEVSHGEECEGASGCKEEEE